MLAASLHAFGRYAPFGSLRVYLAPLGTPCVALYGSRWSATDCRHVLAASARLSL